MNIGSEILFWSGILKDHANFQKTLLTYTEEEKIEKANMFFNEFSKQEQIASNAILSEENLKDTVSENKMLVNEFVQFKKELLKDLLTCKVKLSMTPTFMNHMINEAMEYYRVLCISDNTLKVDEVLENLRLHKIWLADASGHAFYIASQLDNIEDFMIKEALEFRKAFNGLLIEVNEMYPICLHI